MNILRKLIHDIKNNETSGKVHIRILNLLMVIAISFGFLIANQAIRNPSQSAYAAILDIARLPIWLMMADNNNNNNNNGCTTVTQRLLKGFYHVDVNAQPSTMNDRVDVWCTVSTNCIYMDDGIDEISNLRDYRACAYFSRYENVDPLGTTGDSLDYIDDWDEAVEAFSLLAQQSAPSGARKCLIVDGLYNNMYGLALPSSTRFIIKCSLFHYATMGHEYGHCLGCVDLQISSKQNFLMYRYYDEGNKKWLTESNAERFD